MESLTRKALLELLRPVARAELVDEVVQVRSGKYLLVQITFDVTNPGQPPTTVARVAAHLVPRLNAEAEGQKQEQEICACLSCIIEREKALSTPAELFAEPVKLVASCVGRGRFRIEWRVDAEVDEATAVRLQQEAGYDPRGYGFYNYQKASGKTTWSCGGSSD